MLAVSGKKVTSYSLAFRAAGHLPMLDTVWRCQKCGTTMFDFIKKGQMPCLVK